ncbi:MAG: hypothetical protein CBE41_01520 [Gammaproteobacteria bacterium TMED281]|nr:MAG: hypothetical protein CBE41_01520 [Gammaproteobacteria bacterium TMED281]
MSNKITIYIDGQMIECNEGITVIKAADDAGIYIPRFCYHEKLSIVANCRMCLVEIVGAPKTLPACATYVTPDMQVYTRSAKTLESQKAVMEFLLINHPLDCPICDQGGECELQDISMGFGKDISQYTKGKRVVDDEDLGPLVATDMTRCIHCTRCVRFGTEIAGIEELGTLNRGGNMAIGTYLKRGLKSELSGNVIDLCPVGALTSKPYRFNGRSWGFKQHQSISAHDGVGSNLYLHSIHNGLEHKIMRVVPKKNDNVNENWISDRDRFSYEGVTHPNRLTHPMIKTNDEWKQVSWETALAYAADCITQTIQNFDEKQIAAIAHPSSSNEEFFTLQKLFRKLQCENLDYRIRQEDFSDANQLPKSYNMPISLEDIESEQSIVLIGSNPRSEQPLLNHRIKKSVDQGSQCISIDSHHHDFNYSIEHCSLVSYNQWSTFFSTLLTEVQILKKQKAVHYDSDSQFKKQAKLVAKLITSKKSGVFMIGPTADEHPQAGTIRSIIREIAEITNYKVAYLASGANATGGSLTGMTPHTNGLNFKQMFDTPRKLYWLHNIEPLYDCTYPEKILNALDNSFVISCNHYDSETLRKYSNIILPICTPSEMAGSFTNLEGVQQKFDAAIPPVGESKAGWKVLTALARTMALDGFEYEHGGDVLNEIEKIKNDVPQANQLPKKISKLPHPIMWVHYVNPLRVDDIVRHASSLQSSIERHSDCVKFNSKIANTFKINANQGNIHLMHAKTNIEAPFIIDDQVADDTLIIPDKYAISFPRHCQIKLRQADV